MNGSSVQPLHQPPATPRPRAGAAAYRSPESWPDLPIPESLSAAVPTAGLWVPGAYASVLDLVEISIPQDSAHEWTEAQMRRWLLIGAARVNEHLGQRGWPVPLQAWSETVVWANCELAYAGLYRQRGGNTEGDWQNFRAREAAALEWCRQARDREVTPDPRPSDADLGQQALRYVGDRARGWDQPPGYLRGGWSRW